MTSCTALRLARLCPFTRTDNGKPVASTVVNENFNNVYDYYMSGDIGETIIKTNRPQPAACARRRRFVHQPLGGILYTSCDEMRSLDYRHYDGENILDYIADYQPDVVPVRDDLTCITTEGNGTMGLCGIKKTPSGVPSIRKVPQGGFCNST